MEATIAVAAAAAMVANVETVDHIDLLVRWYDCMPVRQGPRGGAHRAIYNKTQLLETGLLLDRTTVSG
jgi:hypothetical protein